MIRIPPESRLVKTITDQLILVLRRTKDIGKAAKYCGVSRKTMVSWLRELPEVLEACPGVRGLRAKRRYFGQWNRRDQMFPSRPYNIMNDYGDHIPENFPPDKS